MDELLTQCMQYFKQEGFDRFFGLMRKKYESLGYIGGTIHLTQLSEIEKATFDGFLRMDLAHQDSLSISIKKIKKILLDTKFAEISLETILVHYFEGDILLSNRQKQNIYQEEQRNFYDELFKPFFGTSVYSWIESFMKETNGIPQFLSRRYETDKEHQKVQIQQVLTALNHLPKWQQMKQRMPLFASEITGNPHAFDEGGPMFSILLQGICYMVGLPYSSSMDAETKMNVLYEAGILKDDISSFAITYRFYATCNSVVLPGWRDFAQRNEPLLVSLANLYDVTSIHTETHVYVVENPSVFSALMEHCKAYSMTHVSLMCTYGQLRVASIQILDMLVQNGRKFHYAGDFDPEGLQIAQKLCQRYQDACILWHYNEKDYELSLSNEKVGESRLKKLDSISESRLFCLKKCLEHKQRNAYQESLIELYKEDLKNLIISQS